MRHVAFVFLITASLSAQSPPSFDAATIKPSSPDARGGSIGFEPGGRWVMVNAAMGGMIRSAYPTDDSELLNAPPWVDTDPYDVIAKAEGDPSREQSILMLQSLLADRFKLKVHYETRERPVLALVIARSDGRLGADLVRSQIDCDAVAAERKQGRQPEVKTTNGALPCGYSVSGGRIMTMQSGGISLSRMARSLGRMDGRIVVDKTGLAGDYEFTLRYSDTGTGDTPSLVTALQEQLGLKLVPDRAQLKMLVIDHIERPTPD